jgi:hypothetical protein
MCDVMASVLPSSELDCCFEPQLVLATSILTLRNLGKDWLAWHQDNVSKWTDISTCAVYCFFRALAPSSYSFQPKDYKPVPFNDDN